jgi:cellulose biosynthesis protein BcsQ
VNEVPPTITEPPSELLHSVEASPTRGLVYTFYSYKGGVGRSMALANTAILLARAGQRVLMVDWDLEAPGLELFFRSPSLSLSRPREETPGVVDLIWNVTEGTRLAWRNCLIDIIPQRNTLGGAISLITAGKLGQSEGDDYVQRLRKLNWSELFNDYRLGERIEEWRSEWIRSYDVVLIDSRTGISDIGNICTILFPDVLILVFTTSGQSIDGIADVMRRSRAAQAALPVDRARLAAVPLLSRDERERETDLSLEWRKQIASALGEYYRDWLPPQVTPEDVLQKLYIPQIAYWSFGERLPVVDHEGEMSDPRSISSSYVRLARLMQYQLDWTKIEGDESAFAEVVKRAENERLRAEEERRLAEENKRRVVEEERRAREEERLIVARKRAKDSRNRTLWLTVNLLALFLGMIAIAIVLAEMVDQNMFPGSKSAAAFRDTVMYFVGAGGSAFAEVWQASTSRRRPVSLDRIIRSIVVNIAAGFFVGTGAETYLHAVGGSPAVLFIGLFAGIGVNFVFNLARDTSAAI